VEERDRLLRLAVARYERTLEIEPEDLDAHYWLAQSYGPAGESVPAAKAGSANDAATPAVLQALAAALADAKAPSQTRLQPPTIFPGDPEIQPTAAQSRSNPSCRR